MPERLIHYSNPEFLKNYAEEYIFVVMSKDPESLRETLDSYRQNKRSADGTVRLSHVDQYMLCAYTGIFPESFRLGNTLREWSGYETIEDNQILADFFKKNGEDIIARILDEIEDNDSVYWEKRSKHERFS